MPQHSAIPIYEKTALLPCKAPLGRMALSNRLCPRVGDVTRQPDGSTAIVSGFYATRTMVCSSTPEGWMGLYPCYANDPDMNAIAIGTTFWSPIDLVWEGVCDLNTDNLWSLIVSWDHRAAIAENTPYSALSAFSYPYLVDRFPLMTSHDAMQIMRWRGVTHHYIMAHHKAAIPSSINKKER